MEDGAAGDPASNGISVLLANMTFPTDPRYDVDFREELDFLENVVPRDPQTGAISHRTEYVQLWSGQFFFFFPGSLRIE